MREVGAERAQMVDMLGGARVAEPVRKRRQLIAASLYVERPAERRRRDRAGHAQLALLHVEVDEGAAMARARQVVGEQTAQRRLAAVCRARDEHTRSCAAGCERGGAATVQLPVEL